MASFFGRDYDRSDDQIDREYVKSLMKSFGFEPREELKGLFNWTEADDEDAIDKRIEYLESTKELLVRDQATLREIMMMEIKIKSLKRFIGEN